MPTRRIISSTLNVNTVEDAIDVSLSPESVILVQNESDGTISLANAYTTVSVNKGGIPVNGFTVSILGVENCQASVNNTTKRIQLTQISTHDDIPYDNGYVSVRVTYEGQTYDRRFVFYVNLLGTWKETVIGDTKTEIAKSNLFDIDPQTGEIIESNYLGEYIRSSTENISRLTNDIYSKNLLSGTSDGNGWFAVGCNLTFDATDFSFSTDDAGTVFSPTIKIEKDKTYTISVDTNSAGVTPVIRRSLTNIPGNQMTDTLSLQWLIDAETYRDVATFSVAEDMYICFTASDNEEQNPLFEKPMLEEGRAMTGWVPDKSYASHSEIRQTADSISLAITNGLRLTGINIVDRIINLIADKTNFYNTNGVKMISFEMYDDGTGIGPLPSILFYDQNGQNSSDHTAHLQWVLNFRGLTQAINASTPYSWGRQAFAVNQDCYDGDVGMSELDEIVANEIGRALFGGNTGDMIRYRTYYVYYAGYYIGNDGRKIKSGEQYEEKYWDSQAVDSLSYPTGGHPSGYYLIENGETLLVTKIVSSNDSEARASADFDNNTLRAGAIEDNTETPDDTASEGDVAGNEVTAGDQQLSGGEVRPVEGFKYYDLVSLNANGELVKVYEKFLQAHYSWTEYTDGRPAVYNWCKISEIRGSLCNLNSITIGDYLD